MNPTVMSRVFSKWWDRRKVVGGNRAEASVGWSAGVQWALEQAAVRLEQGMTGREPPLPVDEERMACAEELRQLAKDLQG